MNSSNEPHGEILPQIEVLGDFEVGNSPKYRDRNANNNFYVSDAVLLSRRKVEFRLGREIFRTEFNQRVDNTNGIAILLSFPDFLLGLPAGPVGAGGNGTTLSNIFFSGVVAGTPDVGERASAAHLFALDDWKATRTLTINLGVRVEVNGQQSESEGRVSNFYPHFYVPPPAGGFTDPISSGFVLPDNYHGYPPAGFPRPNSPLLNHPIELHPEPRIGFAGPPFSSKVFLLRSRYA